MGRIPPPTPNESHQISITCHLQFLTITAITITVRFHIAHLYEVSNRIKTAKELYEQLLQEKDLPVLLRADISRQLGASLSSTVDVVVVLD